MSRIDNLRMYDEDIRTLLDVLRSRHNRHPDTLGLLADDGSIERAEGILIAALEGLGPDVSRDLAMQLRPRGGTTDHVDKLERIDPLTARMMAAQGVDPLVLGWISEMSGNLITLASDDDTHFEMGSRGIGEDSETSVAIGCDVFWEASDYWGSVLVPSLPQTLVQACVGSPLSAVLSHPMLDPLDLMITRVIHLESGSLQLVTDQKPQAIAVDDLLAISTAFREAVAARTPSPERGAR